MTGTRLAEATDLNVTLTCSKGLSCFLDLQTEKCNDTPSSRLFLKWSASQSQPGLHRQIQDNQGYTERPCLNMYREIFLGVSQGEEVLQTTQEDRLGCKTSFGAS